MYQTTFCVCLWLRFYNLVLGYDDDIRLNGDTECAR